MLQPRESRLLWRRRKRRLSMEGLCCSRIFSTLIIIGCLTSLPQGLTQHNDDIYIVKPTPALRFGKEDLTTVLLVNNENHGRFINVRPEVGLLTSTARTFIQEGVTTEYATQVVGTTLDNGRVYAQYLKKSSRVLYDGGSAVPSVVTSWVGESLHSEAVFLPQSHNDLFDADQPDWQDIDDRLLGDRVHQEDFVGNTDYVGLRSKSSSATSSQGEIKSLSTTSSLGYTTNSKSSYDFVMHLGENVRKVAANKVLPIGDLPTYTIKQNYEPSAYLTSNDDVGLEDDNDEEAVGRNPKLIYKKLMQNHVRSEYESASVLHAPKPLIPFSRHFATVTYYGFADFTTVVGDSVIVFSPSTSTHNTNYQAQVTSIKGEATLGDGLPPGPSITKVPITISQHIIEPTIAQRPSIKTLLDAASATTMEMDNSLEETSSTSSSSSTTVITISSEKTEVQQESVTLLESSEVVVQPTQSEMSSIASTSTTAPVMLSRPSDEEILRIYNALANANVEADKVQIQSTNALNTTIITDATSAYDEVQLKTSSVEIFGGATTIFFEDDPFANFVDASKTQTSINLDSTFATHNMSTSLSMSNTFSLKESADMPMSTSLNTIEVTTEESKSETTTDAVLTSSEIILDTEVGNTITIPVPNTKHSNQDANSPTDILPNVLIKEIDPNNEEVPQDCISTSQVFLTQLPKTVTQMETVVITINESELRTEIKQQIQPTFEIKEATKYYCIQASQIQANQIESPLVKPTISALENKDQDLATVDVTEVNEEDVTETFVWTTTLFPDKTEQSDVDEKKQDISKPTGLATSAELEVDEQEDDGDGDEEASGQPDDEEEDDEEIELIYKTLYTTYTYLTTFFHDESTSISSHTEVVTNVMTSTLGISSTKESTSTYITANVGDNEINHTGSLAVTTQMETTKRYVVPSEVESFIRTDDIEMDADIVDNPYVSIQSSESLTTFYTTYTYYTTIFAEGETDIMSHTEIITNVKKSATLATSEAEKIMPTISSYSAAVKEENIATTIYQGEEKLIREIESSSMSRSLAANYKALLPDIPELGDLSAITLITDVRSSSSPGDKQIINNISSPAKISNVKVLPQQESILEDQISSESNTDTDEIIPSATLLLQTSFTTFTYYTTMYSGDETNVISRLETMTNTVTETLKPSKTIDLKGASLPITYFTTFTYWTKLAKEGQITTLSREEIISNVIVPTMVQPETQETHTQIESLETTKNKDSETTTETTLTEETTLHGVHDENVLKQAHQAELTTNISTGQQSTNILEPTTYYTTYTYYTTSYEADKTITDSRFETATNIVTATVTLANTKERNEDSVKLEKPLSSSATPAQSQINVSDASTSELVLYDFKKIIDADGISTIFFTTEIKPTLNSDGVLTEVISSTSSLLINEEKRSIQPTDAIESSANSLGVEGQMQKQYKTGLVRLIEGTRIANRTTTLYQSKVIGTIIDQRYAQIIESTSSFIFEKSRAPEDSNSLNLQILPTSSSDVQSIQATQQVSLESSISLPKVEGSITETSSEQDIEGSTKPAEEVDEENYSKTDEKLRFPFQTKKPPFISPLKPFSNRNRPQFAPKKNGSATIITRSDFTPTITATPALKTISRFSSTRRGSSSSNSISFASSSRRFGRPSKSSVAGSGLQAASTLGQAASRNRFASSTSARGSFASSSRRLGGSSNIVRPSFSRPSLFSSGYSGNSRLRVRPTSTADIGEVSSAIDIATSVPLNSQEEGGGVSQAQDNLEDNEDNATESNRKQNNPLLRLRRPLNRPQGFTPARPQTNSPNNAVSLRRNPLINRGRSSNVDTLTSTTTTTTAKPKPRTFQPPLIAQNRLRPTNSLFPPRNIFGVQKAAVTTEENKDLSEEDTNENNDDSEYDDDDEESEGDDEEESSRRRRRSHNNTELVEKHKLRNKREADSAQQNRSNFRNRFRRPKLASHAQAESKSSEDEASEAKEPVTTGIPASTTATQRTRTRFGARYSQHSSSSTTSATTSGSSSNHKAIRPTRPTSNGRAQFTLRDKDSSAMSTTQKGLTTAQRPAFRRPQPGGTHGTRRLPSSTAPSSSSSSSSGKRRLKSFTNNDATTTSRNSVTGRSRSSSTTSGRSRVSSPSRDSNIGGRNRARNNHNYNSNNNNEPLIIEKSGTITVTHVIPTEVTIPVVNGKVTEYKQVITAKTSTEILEPQQYTTTIAANGLPQLALTREDSSVNYNGATEVTQYVLHETPTTTITFTPTTIRGRKTSFSHVLPSTVYSVEQVVSTVQPQISANAPLANILLSQLLLGNVGLQAGNPLLGALGGALSQPGAGTAVGPAQPATPITEYKTHASTYVTTVVEGQSTVLPITFQGKKILTTIFDTTAQTITATEFITDTIVTTPTALVQPQPAVNSLLLQQLLLQQHLQQQQQQLQQPTPDPSYPLNAILNSVPPQFLLGGDNLQELEASNNIRGSGQSDLLNDDDDFTVGSSVDLDDIALQAQAQTHKTGRKKTRKNGKNHKRKQNNNVEAHGSVESSVITLYVSGRRPGEFSTVLSTVQVRPDSTQYKRHAHTIDTETDYLNDGSELVHEYLALPPEIILLDGKDKHENEVVYENEGIATQSLESIVGDVSLWYSTQTSTSITTSTADLSKVSATEIIIDQRYDMAESPRLNVDSHVANSTSPEIRKQFEQFDSGQEEPKADTLVQRDAAALKSSYDYRYTEDYNDNNSNNGQSQNDDMDEARYNLATRIMSNGVEVIIASDKTKTSDRIVPDVSNNQQHYNKPMTLAASTIKNQMMIFLFPSSRTPTDYQNLTNQSKQLDFNLPFHTNHFITKTCLTTYTYRTTYIHDGRTTVDSREKVISNIATEERNYPKITPSQTIGLTLTRTPELAVGIFPTTYSYFNTFKDNNNKLQVMTSEHTVVNTITGPNDYVAFLQPTAKATADVKTNTYFNEVTVTLSPVLNSKIQKFKRNITQVVITKSYLPPQSTSVLTSYYAFDNIYDSENILKSSVGEKEEIDPDGDLIDKTNMLQNQYIYATKTFLTTFTYYTTTVLNSYVREPSQTELNVKPTAYNYYTRVIENVITDSIPATLLSDELLANINIELKRLTPNQRDRQRIIVTTATLKNGQTVKISAMEMYKSNMASSSLPLSATVEVLHQDLVMNPEATADKYQMPGEADTTNDFPLQESPSLGNLSIEEHGKYPTYQESFGEENNVIAFSPSEQILSIVGAQSPEILPTNVNISSVISQPTSAANQLIQRLTALKPMFNAMADILQNNFGANRDMVKPIKTIESKQAANKKINSNSTMDTIHPIYIPVQKSPLKNNIYEISNHSEFSPQSLHIKPPLRLNEEGQFEANTRKKSPHDNYANLIPFASLTAPIQEQPLRNGGIYIRPGEIITANSDVIVGKPNGIEYVQIPHQFAVDNNTSKAYTLNNRQFQVTYYHNQIQHPYKMKSSAAINSPITHRPQHIPIIGGLTGNNFSPQPTLSLRPQNDLHFNKNILKPPPPPPPPKLHQSHIPLHTQPGLSLLLTAPDKPKTSNKPQIYNAHLATESATSTMQSHLLLPISRHKITEHKPSLRGTHNYYNLNNDLKNNEILEIQKLPQVFSADLKPNTMHTTNLPKLSNINRKPQNQPHISSIHNNVNTEINLSNDKNPTTLESYQNSALNERESQTALTYLRFQLEKEEIAGEYLTNLAVNSNRLNGQETQKKPNFPSHRQVDSATNFAVIEQPTQMENANALKSSMELIWNLQHGVQAAKNNKFSTHLIQEKPNALLNYENEALSSNLPNAPPNFLSSPSKGNLHYKPSSIKKLNNPTNFLISPSNGNLPYKQSGLSHQSSPNIFITSPSISNSEYNPSGSIVPNTSPNILTSPSNVKLHYKISSSNLPNTPYKFLISPSNKNVPYKPSSKPTSQHDAPKSKQNIAHSNTNDSWTKNHQNVSLHQHVFSHTVDVNVPPLTFNREDIDYPQHEATAVRGQIPSATVNELNTPAKPLYQYMPLITIPAHEQQVQVSLTPLNMLGTLTSPIEVENETSLNKKSAEENSNNIERKMSLPNNNFNIYENDQKTFAKTNILSVKTKQNTTSNSKQNRRQHNTTSRPADTTRRKTPEKKSKTEQHLKTTVKPNGIHQQTTKKTIQPLVQVPLDMRYTYQSLGPSIPQESMTAVNSQLYSTKANDTDWLISQDYRDKEHEHNLTSKPQQADLNEEAFTIIKPNREKYLATRVSIPKTNVFAMKNIQNAKKQAIDERTTAEGINEIMNSLKTENEGLNAVQLVTQGKPFRKSINYNGQQTEYRNTERHNQTKMAAIFVAPGEAFRTNKPSNRHNTIDMSSTKEFSEIFVTRESQYLATQQTTGQTKKIFNKTTTVNTAKPMTVDTKPWTSKIPNASTETVFGFQPPPPLTTLTTSSTTTPQTKFTNYSLSKIQNKALEMIGKRQPIKTSDNRQAVNINDKLIPDTTSTDTTVNDKQIVRVPDKSYKGYNITTTKTINDIIHINPRDNGTLKYFENEGRKRNDSFQLVYLLPSESYKEKISSTTTTPLTASLFTFTTTTTTTTTIKRIILPTKYVTNKRIYTVTTTASNKSPPTPHSTYIQKTTSFLSTTETTTEVRTLFFTHTQINTILDAVTSVKTLEPITVTATSTTTTTHKPSTSTNSRLATLAPVASHAYDINPDSVTSKETHMHELKKGLSYLAYPSVEVVSANISQESALHPDENSIFIIMTNQKNKNNIFAQSPSPPQHGNKITQKLTEGNDIAQTEESNDLIIEYDNGITFDDIPTIRDEEPGQIVNGKSVFSSDTGNHVVVAVKENSSDDQLILGGVLIATPPKSPTEHIQLNDSISDSCLPKCKASRNEQCFLVDNHWSCLCRPGFARMFPDRPCKPTYTYALLMHAERVGNYPLQYVNELTDNKTEHYKQLSQLINNALDRMIMQSDFRDSYHGVEVTQFDDDHKNHQGILITILLQLSDNSNEKRLEEVFKKHLRLSNYSIGGTDIYTNKAGVDALAIKDFNECLTKKLHDCSQNANCFNLPGTYTCSCVEGFADISDNPIYPGRICSSEQIGCEMCHYHGKCFYASTTQVENSIDRNYCECFPWYAGFKCQVNLKILLIVLLGIGTLLFILLLFCILITCTKRHSHLQHTALAPSTVTSSSVDLQKNSRMAANMLITSVGLHSSSLVGGSLKNNKRQKCIKIDKRSMIKDSSSETSQNSLPYALKNRDLISESFIKKKGCLNHSTKCSNRSSLGVNTMEQYSMSVPSNVQAENPSELNTVITTSSSSFKGNQINQQTDKNLLGNATEFEGHYCEQSDRSLTVMIPRAKYHSSVLSQTQLMHHQLTMERIYKTAKPENKFMNVEKCADVKRNYKKNVSITREITDEEKRIEIPANPGALISAGFEVSAIVRDNNTMAVNTMEQKNNDLVRLDSIPPNYTILTTSEPATTIDSNSGQKPLAINEDRQHFTANKKCSTNESDYNVYKCEKDLIETMDEWLGNIKLNELSAEARSFDETTLIASTKPLRTSVDGTQTQRLHDEVNTMAERDLGSTFLLPHTHLYKPERQDTELSGFDSF